MIRRTQSRSRRNLLSTFSCSPALARYAGLAPLMSPSTNRLRSTPFEVVFRIFQRVFESGSTTTASCEQTIEVALGPSGASANGNIGILKRRVPASQVVHAMLPPRGKPKPPKKPHRPKVQELLLKAIEWKRQLDAGEVVDQAGIARREELTRARVTQILNLLKLPSAKQERILNLPKTTRQRRLPITERGLRSAPQKVAK